MLPVVTALLAWGLPVHPGLLDLHCHSAGHPSLNESSCSPTQCKKRKEKFTLVSDHKGSLLRRQPGAPHNARVHALLPGMQSKTRHACFCIYNMQEEACSNTYLATDCQQQLTAAVMHRTQAT